MSDLEETIRCELCDDPDRPVGNCPVVRNIVDEPRFHQNGELLSSHGEAGWVLHFDWWKPGRVYAFIDIWDDLPANIQDLREDEDSPTESLDFDASLEELVDNLLSGFTPGGAPYEEGTSLKLKDEERKTLLVWVEHFETAARRVRQACQGPDGGSS